MKKRLTAALCAALLLLLLYCLIYLFFTPRGYLPAQPWHYYF